MGKKGDLLRAAKRQSVVRTFTEAELIEHDKMIARNAVEQRKKELKEELDKRIDVAMSEYFDANAQADIFKILRYSLAVSCKVLIEKFGWPTVGNRLDKRKRLIRFITAVEDEMMDIEEYSSLCTYSEKVRDMYGIEFVNTSEDVAERAKNDDRVVTL